MDKRNIVILGMGGHGRVCESIVKDYGLFSWLGYVDDVHPKKCLGSSQELPQLQKKHKDLGVFVAIGVNSAREAVVQKVRNMGISLISIIHPSSIIAKNVKVGQNVFVGPRSIINNASVIGDGVYINSGCIVEHDNKIDDFVHLAPGVITGGVVKIGRRTFVGMGCVVNDHLEIADDVFIASGAVVYKKVEKGQIVGGVPAKSIKMNMQNRNNYQ